MALQLRGMVSGAVGVVNPTTSVTIRKSTGSVMQPDGSRVPSYQEFLGVPARVQSLTDQELRQVEGLNIQDAKQAAYIDGNWGGVLRPANKGGDLLVFPDGSVWLVVDVLESWTTWTKVVLVLQNGA